MSRWWWIVLSVAVGAGAQTVAVPNPSFETGRQQPDGWQPPEGRGEWLATGGAEGQRAISVTGDGENSNYWRSSPLAMAPKAVYRLRFRARGLGATTGGTPVTGPTFANHDLGQAPDTWAWFTQYFVTPDNLSPDDAWLRFGQWCVRGTVAFDQVSLVAAQPVYARHGDLTLGEGERVTGHQYAFEAPFGGLSRNQSRPLDRHHCYYNSTRWTFGQDSQVVYHHRLGDRHQAAAQVSVNVGYYTGGELLAEVSANGTQWQKLGAISSKQSQTWPIPAALLPATDVWVRLTAQARQKVGANSDPGSFQVHSYHYEATLDGPELQAVGTTRFAAVPTADPRLGVTLLSLGEGLPGGENQVVAALTATGTEPVRVTPQLTLSRPGEPATPQLGAPVTVGREPLVVKTGYAVPGTGTFDVVFGLAGSPYRAELGLDVAELYNLDYGEALPSGGPQAGLWWCSSGWKVSRIRPRPTKQGQAVKLSVAGNESEAAQLVVRPTAPLQGFQARATALTGPGGATLPADRVDVLRVSYVRIAQPTDATGVAADWPDPLPPFTRPIDLAAGVNQPLWIRVNAPKDTPAGEYHGQVVLTAAGYRAEVPLTVQVYGFSLPDTLTCQSGFGFSPGNVFRYQHLTTEAQQRQVLDKYWASFAAHHVAPYDPAPLDRFGVRWPGGSSWQGGTRDARELHDGRRTLRLEKTTAGGGIPSAQWPEKLAIPPSGLRLSFWYKAAAGHPFIVTFNHHDATGQWMSGRNNDMRVEGTGQWTRFDRLIRDFPAGAKQLGVTLWPVLWDEAASHTGTVWYDQVSLKDEATGRDLVAAKSAGERLEASFDWARWDREMERVLAKYHFTAFTVPVQGMGGGTFYSREEPSLLGYSADTPEYRALFTSYCRQLEDHLKAKGWLDKTYVYWFDEPDTKDFPFVLQGCLRLKAAAPGLRRMMTKEPAAGLVGGINLWCPLTPTVQPEQWAARRQQGEAFWWYVCTGPKAPYCTLFIDHPATELRAWLWQTWQHQVTGVLVWETTYWTSPAAYPDSAQPQNPYADPMSWVSGYGTPAGTRQGWGNGDGRFMYPPEAAADGRTTAPVLDGPVDSLRWEMLRDGLEDYEYLAILSRLLQARGAGLPAAERQAAEELLRVPPAITTELTKFTTSPAPIEARRAALAAAIERLRAR